MVRVEQITLADFERMPKKPTPLGERGIESTEILGTLQKGRPIRIVGASRGFQVALSQRIKREKMKVEMRIEREAGGFRTIALLMRR